MRITSSKRVAPASNRVGRTAINAGTSITSGIHNRQVRRRQAINASAKVKLTEAQTAFLNQLKCNINRVTRGASITAATNTANIMARPEFMDLLPVFVQKLLILDVFGSVAMKSRQQLIPYFKFIAENTKGVTQAGDVLSSPFANRQGIDPDFGGRAVRGEKLDGTQTTHQLNYGPILPGTVTIKATKTDGTEISIIDPMDMGGQLFASTDVEQATALGTVDYSSNTVTLTETYAAVKATYQYDNETVGHNQETYGAKMGKGYLMLDEINLVAEAHQLACYWSIYSAFAAQTEYGSNIANMAKDAAFSELTAEINTQGFKALEKAAIPMPAFNWDAGPVLSGSVVPSDYLNMFKLKLGQAAASIYQRTRLSQPNRLSVGTTVAEYLKMVNGFKAEGTEDNVGPYKLGTLDQFECYVCPEYDPTKWVMSCKSNDIRRNSALFGEYMPLTDTDPIVLGNMSGQQGYATMYAMDVVNPSTIASGKILGAF